MSFFVDSARGLRSVRRRGDFIGAALLVLALVQVAASEPIFAWSADGHRQVSKLAARLALATSGEMPEFFLLGNAQIAAASIEPDVLRNRGTPQLRDREYPEHYIDLELLEGADLPATRYEYLDLLDRLELSARFAGTVPYAVVEATQHLAIAFAEHRQRPDDESIRGKILYLAGILSHYSADMSQPLHTTIHHNGRAREDNSSPRTGIHHKVDSLPGRAGARLSLEPGEPWPVAYEDLWRSVIDELEQSHSLVDRVYALESELDWDVEVVGALPPPEAKAFADERLTAASLFTARLFVTAWHLSASIELPVWVFEGAQPPAQ